mmetsp:Transcript_21245/g.51348  ORF Transcript_21245/g.51348 Transcript_21245/m.51348 type:complete len:273 (+) Transcript_21245:1091-1909(+)
MPSTFSMTAAFGFTFLIVSTIAKKGRAFSSANRSLFTCSFEKGLHGNPQTYKSMFDGKRDGARDKISVSSGAGPSSNFLSSISENKCCGRKLRAMNLWHLLSTSHAATTSRPNLGPPACATASCSWCSATTGASAPLQSVITRTCRSRGIPDHSSSSMARGLPSTPGLGCLVGSLLGSSGGASTTFSSSNAPRCLAAASLAARVAWTRRGGVEGWEERVRPTLGGVAGGSDVLPVASSVSLVHHAHAPRHTASAHAGCEMAVGTSGSQSLWT